MAVVVEVDNVKQSSADVARWVAWSRLLNDFLVARGWVRTGDTGQIDFTSPPGAVGSAYFILRPNDTLQSTLPFYLKFSLGTNTLGVQMGTGTDGTGGLTGAIGSNRTVYNGSNSEINYDCYFAGDNDWFAAAFFRGATGQGLIACERFPDAEGVPTGNGAVVVGSYGSANTQFQHTAFPSGGGYEYYGKPLPCLLPWGGGGAYGGFRGASPVYPYAGGALFPLQSLGVAPSGDFADTEIVPLSLYGLTRNYIALNVLVSSGPIAGSSTKPLLRWS